MYVNHEDECLVGTGYSVKQIRRVPLFFRFKVILYCRSSVLGCLDKINIMSLLRPQTVSPRNTFYTTTKLPNNYY